ncbi:MFS transporter [Arenibaculum pallidiluteum]|uniref:MFS transporter n=1 Tax=Arenibaculum pallidiluteum TaxID=2812559 RepID=UPI001A95FFEA|nr:MFS transporter [Arenibaculum pallidiluteum]
MATEDSSQAQAAPLAPSAPSSLSPFRYPMYRAIWIATLVSNLGVWIQSVGASWLMTSIAPSADMVALVQSATALPVLLFSLVGGSLADLWDRRLVFLTGQLIVLAGAVALAILQGLGSITPWLLLGLTFVLDSGSALRQPAYQSTVGELVPRSELVAAISLNSIAFNLARSVGPALGGLVVASIGVQASFVINALCNLFIIGVLLTWRRPRPVSELPRETFPEAVRAGFRYVRGSPAILVVMLRCFVFTALAGAVWALLPLVARHDLGGGPMTFGILLGCLGAGAILGALVIGPLRRRVPGGGLVAAGSLGFSVPCLAIAAAPTLWVAVPALVVGGAAWMTTLSSFNVMVQVSSANWVKARALAIYFMALFGGLALGSWCWGHAAEAFGNQAALAGAGAGLLLSLLLVPVTRLPADLNLDLSPLTETAVPTLAPGVVPGKASVAVTIEYRIAPERAAEFLRAMRPLRRLRLRDGALRWTIYQDSADPGRWIEAFILPSWSADLRHQRRLTAADRVILERAASFHQGPEPPRTSHLLARGARRMGWPPGR